LEENRDSFVFGVKLSFRFFHHKGFSGEMRRVGSYWF
jgi:hypothetical protein